MAGERVDVARQRAVDEPDVHAQLDLLDRLGLDEVGPMRQYCSGGSSIWSSIQPLLGRLQQRVVEEEAEAAARLQHPGDLGDRLVDVVDVLEHEAGDDRVERTRRRTAAPAAPART